MKVRCISTREGGPEEFSPWLSIGREYYVLSIERDSLGKTWYRIQTDEREDSADSVALHASSCFELISDYRPSRWRERPRNSGLVISPEAWQAEGFWEALYNGDNAAEVAFAYERDLIFHEEP